MSLMEQFVVEVSSNSSDPRRVKLVVESSSYTSLADSAFKKLYGEEPTDSLNLAYDDGKSWTLSLHAPPLKLCSRVVL